MDGGLAEPSLMRQRSMAPPDDESSPTCFELLNIDLMKLHNIDVQKSSFQAQIWIEFTIRGGALDADLSKEGAVFPIGEDGKPTFKPSAGWYMQQVDFRNAHSVKVIDSKSRMAGDDILIAMRYEGVFSDEYQLDDFPFDQQGLTILLNFNCRVGGPLPMELVVSPSCKITLSCIDLCPPAREWTVNTKMKLNSFIIGEDYDTDRVFPALSITAQVKRKPMYHILNLAMPMGLFSVLSLMQAACNANTEGSINHRHQMTLMMVLTATAYKMAIAGKLPPVSYLTWLDKYTLCNYLLIIAVAVQSRALTQLGGDDQETGLFDMVCTAVAAGFWGLMHAYLIQIAVKNYLIGGTMRDYYLRNRKALSVTKVYRKGESKRSIETPSSLTEESVRASSRESRHESAAF
eukprot:scaffold135146_cov66-Phaeocystis_antarctica.AAC.3